jgi:hypothetical protein
MNRLTSTILLTSGLFFAAQASVAATVTIGGFSFDDSSYVDSATLVQGVIDPVSGPLAAGNVDEGADASGGPVSITGLVGGNFNTFTSLTNSQFIPPDLVQIFFTNNTLVNGPGADLLFFGQGGGATGLPTIRVNGTGAMNAHILVGAGSVPLNSLSTLTTQSNIPLNLGTFDFSSLGYADGAAITDPLYVVRGFSVSVFAVAALNNQVIAPPPPPSAVPLPAGLPLLLAGLGAFGLLRRSRKV